MHRSSTSRVAKGLAAAGVHMGDRLLGPAPSNPCGHYEDMDFMELNDRILHAAGGAWDRPPAEDAIMDMPQPIRRRIRDLVEEKQTRGVDWGWKDPRTTLTLPLYVPHLIHPHIVACFRPVKDVAQSLIARDGGTRARAMALAREYNERLMHNITLFYHRKEQSLGGS